MKKGIFMLLTVLGSFTAAAQQDATALAKATQNPVADLTSVPLQFNFTNGGPLGDRTLYNLNVQPVMPLTLNSNWNLIARTIVPFIGIPTAPTERVQGIGDIQMQLFFTPAESGELIWGAGPVVSLPVATNELARTGDWGLGPTVVALKMAGPWVFGAVANQIFTVAGDDDGTEINQFLIQPFLNYNLQRGWAISTGPVITANWEADDDNVWTVPLGLGFSKVHMIGKTPVNLVFQYYRNVVRPETTGDNTVRLAAVLMFPNR